MAELHGLMYPRTPTGVGSILPSPPWHYRQVGNSMHGGTTVWAGPNPMASG